MSESNGHNGQDHEALASENIYLNGQSEPVEEVLNEVSRLLVQARTELGLSEEDIARKLYLNPLRIKQIDSGNFDKIGKPAFLKGYIRSYAREVGLSPDGIIALLTEQDARHPVLEERLSRVSEHRSHTINTTPAAATAIIGVIGVAFVLLAIWWFNPEKQQSGAVSPEVNELQDELQQGRAGVILAKGFEADDEGSKAGTNEIPEPSEPPPESVTATVMANQSIIVAAPSEQAEVDEAEAMSPSVSTESELIFTTEQVMNNLAEPVVSTAEDVQIKRYEEGDWQVVTVSANGEDHLKFTFTDDCWLEVVDARGRPVYGDLNHERERLSVFGNAPFKVLIGRVSAVTVSFNERPVDLQSYAFNDTAKLVIE